MRYLITIKNGPPFLTDWFELENNYNNSDHLGMVVYDLSQRKYCDDGKTWKDIVEDHL